MFVHSGMCVIEMSPYFFPSSFRILMRRYSLERRFESSECWAQSRTTAEAPGAMATSFMASSAGVAVLNSSAEKRAEGSSTSAAAARRRLVIGQFLWRCFWTANDRTFSGNAPNEGRLFRYDAPDPGEIDLGQGEGLGADDVVAGVDVHDLPDAVDELHHFQCSGVHIDVPRPRHAVRCIDRQFSSPID